LANADKTIPSRTTQKAKQTRTTAIISRN